MAKSLYYNPQTFPNFQNDKSDTENIAVKSNKSLINVPLIFSNYSSPELGSKAGPVL